MELKQWAKLQENLLRSQLKIIRQFLKEGEEPRLASSRKGMSQINVIYDILLSAKRPLHVTEIISRAKNDFNVDLNRESIVSSITKKVKSGRMFKRVEPNTFALLDGETKNNP